MIAIIVTIMMLEMKAPHGSSRADLKPGAPVLQSYVPSLANVGIYWNNHHHLLHTVRQVSGPMLWATLHLLFWLSLMSFATARMGENHFESLPTAMYGFVLLMCGVSYTILLRTIIQKHGQE